MAQKNRLIGKEQNQAMVGGMILPGRRGHTALEKPHPMQYEEENRNTLHAAFVLEGHSQNRDRPALVLGHIRVEHHADTDRDDGNAVAYGVVDRGRFLRYGHAQSPHRHPGDSQFIAARVARRERAKEPQTGRDDE
jgi:hypothetical protein